MSKSNYYKPDKAKKKTAPAEATAPFNFAAIHEQLVTHKNDITQDRFYNELLSGYIDLEITTLTPFFTRGSKEKNFRIGEHYAIPGSTLRGMLRSLCEQLSFGKMVSKRHFQDKHLYFRAFADKHKPLREYYKQKIVAEPQAGYLYFDNTNEQYYIKPAMGFSEINDITKEFTYVVDGQNVKIYSGKILDKYKNPIKQINWLIHSPSYEDPIEVDESVIEEYQNDKMRNGRVPDLLKIARKREFKNVELRHGAPVFYEVDDYGNVVSFGHTKYYRIPYVSSISDNIPEEIQNNYELDYADSIFGGELLKDDPEQNKPQKLLRVGSVYCEDCVSYDNIATQKTILNILSSPKPTSFNLYKNKESDGSPSDWDYEGYIRGHKHYWHRIVNPQTLHEAKIIKIKKNDWLNYLKNKKIKTNFNFNKEKGFFIIQNGLTGFSSEQINVLCDFFNLSKEEEKKYEVTSKPQNTLVEVLPAKIKFSGRIRFENLNNKQLGLLLMALDLPKGCAHKLGMGKPHGMGSIQIIPSVFIIDRKKRYESLFDSTRNFYTAQMQSDFKTLEDIRLEFANDIACQLNKNNLNNIVEFWNLHLKLQDLKNLLTLKPVANEEKWIKQTEYMSLDTFRQRPVLPYPDEVIKRAK
jgi:CRISPR/Cas system CSM-associated protein Csm3 (group 7 of RAMP superfamily)